MSVFKANICKSPLQNSFLKTNSTAAPLRCVHSLRSGGNLKSILQSGPSEVHSSVRSFWSPFFSQVLLKSILLSGPSEVHSSIRSLQVSTCLYRSPVKADGGRSQIQSFWSSEPAGRSLWPAVWGRPSSGAVWGRDEESQDGAPEDAGPELAGCHPGSVRPASRSSARDGLEQRETIFSIHFLLKIFYWHVNITNDWFTSSAKCALSYDKQAFDLF